MDEQVVNAWFCSRFRFTYGFACQCLWKNEHILRRDKESCFHVACVSVGTQSCSTPSRRPAMGPDPTCPWFVWVWHSTNQMRNIPVSFHFRRSVYHLSNPKPGHTTGRSGRVGAQRGGEGGQGCVERDAVESILETTLVLAFQRIEDTVLELFSETQTNGILCKPMEERSQRLTRG